MKRTIFNRAVAGAAQVCARRIMLGAAAYSVLPSDLTRGTALLILA